MRSHDYDAVAVIVPCRNEAITIAKVVSDFHEALPGCRVVVADNASTDDTAARARDAGADVVVEPRRGKGNAVLRLFSDVDADCYVLVDGDATYDAQAAPRLVSAVLDDGIDMVVGARVETEELTSYRKGHRLGNALLTWIFRSLFRFEIEDTLSGYRAFSQRFVKSFPGMATGFEIEAELNAHAATAGVAYAEMPTWYRARPDGSQSKLSTYRDGVRILRRNLRLFRDCRPFLSFLALAAPWFLVSVGLAIPVLNQYVATGLVPKFPSLIASVGCFLVALNLAVAGMVLDRVTRSRIEAVRLAYLALPPPTRRQPMAGRVAPAGHAAERVREADVRRYGAAQPG